MSEKIEREMLQQRWIHAHEEDTPSQAVYRPAGYRLPPARGRDGFELGPENMVKHIGIGRGDVRDEAAGVWEIEEGEVPVLRIQLHSGEERRLNIASVEKDRLVVRK